MRRQPFLFRPWVCRFILTAAVAAGLGHSGAPYLQEAEARPQPRLQLRSALTIRIRDTIRSLLTTRSPDTIRNTGTASGGTGAAAKAEAEGGS